MKKRKRRRRLSIEKGNNVGRYVFVTLMIIAVIVTVGYAYSESLPKDIVPSKVSSIVKQSEDVETGFTLSETIVPSSSVYIDLHSNQFTIYIKNKAEDNGTYIGYKITHSTKELDSEQESSNYDVWRLQETGIYKQSSNGSFIFERNITQNGEWEMAINEQGANDFIGGSVHGDEITTSFEAYIDEKDVSLNENLSNKPVNEFVFKSQSDLYRDNTTTDGLERIGVHHKEYVFDEDGLTLIQKVEFEVDTILDRSYLTMLPILRKDGEGQVTDTLILESLDVTKDVSNEDEFSVEMFDATQAKIIGEESGIVEIVSILNKTTDYPTQFFVSDSPSYNKLYFAYVGDDYTVEAGEIWEQETHYDISVKE